MEMMLLKLIKKLEVRCFANGDQAKYNNELRALLVDDEWAYDVYINDVMWFFENVFIGDSFNSTAIVKDFKENHEDEKYSNFLNCMDSIMMHVNDLGLKYN